MDSSLRRSLGCENHIRALENGAVTVIGRMTTAPSGELRENVPRALVSAGGQASVRLEEDVLTEMLLEFKKMNIHMQAITDIRLEAKDISI